MQRKAAEHKGKRRKLALEAQNCKGRVMQMLFDVGYYVLRRKRPWKRDMKPSLRWNGPVQVTKCHGNYLLDITKPFNGKSETKRGRGLTFFSNRHFQVAKEVKTHLAYQARQLLVVQSFHVILKKGDAVEVLFNWKGFGDH